MGQTKTVSKLLELGLLIGLTVVLGSTVLNQNVASANSERPQFSSFSDDIPEEVLQMQIQVEANSSLTGQSQNVATHAREQQKLQVKAADVPPKLSPSIYRDIELLRLLKLLKSLLPFID